VVVDGEGNLLVAGDTNDKLTGIEEDVPGYLFVRKYDPDGNPMWLEQFGNEGVFEEASAVAVDSKGNVFAAGFTNWSGGNQENVDAIVRKYDPDGNELWTQQFGTLFSGARALAVDSEDNLLVACNGVVLGESASAGAVVRKYDPDGNELWTQLEAEELGAAHEPAAMTLDSRGRVFVVGSVAGDASGAAGFIWLVPEP
jgi:catechol 2,3-dioxygenase-like lactoylglutathione lyase family enzyme